MALLISRHQNMPRELSKSSMTLLSMEDKSSSNSPARKLREESHLDHPVKTNATTVTDLDTGLVSAEDLLPEDPENQDLDHPRLTKEETIQETETTIERMTEEIEISIEEMTGEMIEGTIGEMIEGTIGETIQEMIGEMIEETEIMIDLPETKIENMKEEIEDTIGGKKREMKDQEILTEVMKEKKESQSEKR